MIHLLFSGWQRSRAARIFLLLLVSLGTGVGLPPAESFGESPVRFDHTDWDRLLREFVTEGHVDYEAILRDRPRLDAYLARVAVAEPESWTREERMAFWINVYNARMVASVLDHWPVESVLKIDRILWVPTMAVFRKKHPIAGEELSLDNIEHDILRGRFRDPRVHAVLVCASRSCPALASEAYTADRLDRQLTEAMVEFLHDPERNQVFQSPPRLSRIFHWYRDDFIDAAGTAWAYVRLYLSPDERSRVPVETEVKFLSYDWSLNR